LSNPHGFSGALPPTENLENCILSISLLPHFLHAS
jgi:hypothetical protein